MSEKELLVNTESGNIKVVQSRDLNRPGVVISVNGKNLMVVEYNTSERHHSIMVWNSETNESDDYEYVQKFNG